LWARAAAEDPAYDAELRTTGNVYLCTTQEERPLLLDLAGQARAAGLDDVWYLDADGVRKLVPAAVGPFLGAVVAAAVLQPLQSVATGSRRTVPAEARTTATPRSPASSLAVVGLSRTSITLHWVDTNSGASRYVVVVERASGSVSEQAASGTASHTVGSLSPGTGYCLRVATVARPARPVTDPVCARTFD
jgi:hypothetical protein